MVREPKRGKRGRGRERKETIADKPLEFKNRNCNFKIEFGNVKENLLNPSQRKACKGEVLALIGQSVNM